MKTKIFGFLIAAFMFPMAACSTPQAGSACEEDKDCPEKQVCLAEFRGGYCGVKDCIVDADCPEGTFCVDNGGTNYCFLACTDKDQCNEFRSVEEESNCSSNIVSVDSNSSKACVPPSGV